MPSSFLSYAVDFDGDEVADIWNNPVDAIGSVANYFKQHGWRKGETVVVGASAPADVPERWFSRSRSELEPKRSVADFATVGIKPSQPLAPGTLAIALKFELQDGYEYWLGLHNFYVITRYNHSAMYAMSVYELSRRIAAGMAS
jgi:membrane-bound lytic murein transglycosylase B